MRYTARLKIGQPREALDTSRGLQWWIVPAISILARAMDPNSQEPPGGRLGRKKDTRRFWLRVFRFISSGGASEILR